MSTEPTRPNRTQQLSSVTDQSQTAVIQVADSLDALSTQADRAGSLIGFGRRIWVPADEVHVVVGHGYHITRSSDDMQVFGQSANKSSRYWLNPRTQVIKLKTISFTVPLSGSDGRGINALDNKNVSFKLWAHAVAQLNPEKAEVAARRIGQDTQGLLRTITQVAMSQLISAAAQMELKDIIAMLGLEELSKQDRLTVNRARRLERFLTQPFFTTGQFTGLEGTSVSIHDTLTGCERILDDEFLEWPERTFYMIGKIDEATKP